MAALGRHLGRVMVVALTVGTAIVAGQAFYGWLGGHPSPVATPSAIARAPGRPAPTPPAAAPAPPARAEPVAPGQPPAQPPEGTPVTRPVAAVPPVAEPPVTLTAAAATAPSTRSPSRQTARRLLVAAGAGARTEALDRAGPREPAGGESAGPGPAPHEPAERESAPPGAAHRHHGHGPQTQPER